MENKEQIDALLSPFGIGAAEILDYAQPDDKDAIVLLTGTFNLGLATPTSDIDLLTIYPEDRFIHGLSTERKRGQVEVHPLRDGDSAFARSNILIINRTLPTGQKIQTNVVRADYVHFLQDAVLLRNNNIRSRLAGDAGSRIRQGKLIDFEEQVVLHRSYTGLPVFNSAAHRDLANRLALAEIADNVAIRDSSRVQIFISDLRGLLELSGTEERETLLLIQHKILVYLTGAILATVREITPQDKLLFRLLKRHKNQIGESIVTDILQRFSSIYANLDADPRELIGFVKDIFARLTTMSELVAAEYADWNEEATFPLFKKA